MNRESLLTSLESLVAALKEQDNNQTTHSQEYIRKVFALGFKHGLDEAREQLLVSSVHIDTPVDVYAGELCVSGSVEVAEEYVYEWVRDNVYTVSSVDAALEIIKDNRMNIDEVIDGALNPNYDTSKVV